MSASEIASEIQTGGQISVILHSHVSTVAFLDWYTEFKFIPTIKQIRDVATGMRRPKQEEEPEAYKQYRNMAIWYYDHLVFHDFSAV